MYNLYSNNPSIPVLLTALTSLSNTDKKTKLRAAFEIYDTNGDGFITRDEMKEYLNTLFLLRFKSDESVFLENGVSPEELAEETVKGACGGRRGLNYKEFCEWFTGGERKEVGRIESGMGFEEAVERCYFGRFGCRDIGRMFEQASRGGVLGYSRTRWWKVHG